MWFHIIFGLLIEENTNSPVIWQNFPSHFFWSRNNSKVISHNFCCQIIPICFSHMIRIIKQASPGSHERNRFILNRYPSHTEIFSKRRKIYAVWVKDLSMHYQIPILTPNLSNPTKSLWTTSKVGLVFREPAGNGLCLEKCLGIQNVYISIQLLLGKSNFFVHEQPIARPSLGWTPLCCHL